MSYPIINDQGALMGSASSRKKAQARAKRAMARGTRGCAVLDIKRNRVRPYGTMKEKLR